MGLPIVAILLLVACTSPSAASSSLASLGAPGASPGTTSAASAATRDPSEAAPAPSVTATTPSRVVVPQGSQPSAACVQAFAAMEAAGGGTLEPSDPAVLKTLTSWNKTAPGPELPNEVVENTRAKYLDALARLAK